ncbi:MAG: DUF11 domain-containing protein [Lysobacterales bacterium]
MNSKKFVVASLIAFATASAFAGKGDPSPQLRGFGSGAPDGVPTLTFNTSIAPNDTTTTCAAQPAVGEPVITLNLGPNAVVTGIGWNTLQTAFGASWRSEMVVQFYNAAGAVIGLAPGTDDSAGGPTNYFGGPVDLSDNALPNIDLGPTGILRLGLCESFDDDAVPVDGRFTAPSTITIQCRSCVNPNGPPPGADLALTQSNNAAGNALLIGNTFQKTLTVTNNGPSAATAITVTDTLPAQLAFVSSNCGATAAGQVVTYTIPTLANAGVNSCVLTLRITAPGTIFNTAAITASTPADPTPANNTTTAQIGAPGGGIAQTPVPALDRNMVLVLLGLVSVLGMLALRQRQG